MGARAWRDLRVAVKHIDGIWVLHVLTNVYVSLLSYSHSQPVELLFSPTALRGVHTRRGLCHVHFDSILWAVGVQDRVLHVLESLPWWPCGELEGARL